MRGAGTFRDCLGTALVAALTNVIAAPACFAVTLDSATSVRASFQFPLGSVQQSSYDGPLFDAFKPFVGVLGNEFLAVSSFTGLAGGSQLETFLISESAYFDGMGDPNISNKFGVIDSQGNFTSILDSANVNPGGLGTVLQGDQEELTFALDSPEGLFSSIDSQNADRQAHILAVQVVKDGIIEVSPTSLRNTGPIILEVRAGDILLFIEDLLATGNLQLLNVPVNGDFDYNDMVFLVRQTQIPEPGTLLLMGSGMLAALRIRRRRS